MFSRDELSLLSSLGPKYSIIVSNGHDIHLKSYLTGHEWIIISPYDGSPCKVLHRHSQSRPFHRQHGQYGSLSSALDYIRRHDIWFREKMKRRELQIAEKHRSRKYANIRYKAGADRKAYKIVLQKR